MNRNEKVRRMATAAMIAALYTALSLLLGALSFGVNGAIQFRVAEALTLLPLFSPVAILGVTLGCLLTNLIGTFLGLNLLGGLDCIFGTAATLLAAVLTYALRRVRLRGIPWLAWLPPVLCNGVIIGAECCYVFTGAFAAGPLLLNMGYVAIGELLACGLLGLPMVWMLERTGLDQRLFGAKQLV